MTIKAKFVCNGIEIDAEYKQKRASLMAVTSGSEENKSFATYTPSGQLNISISEETPAYEFFEQGKEYYLTFDEVQAPVSGD